MKARLIKIDTDNFVLQTIEGIISGTLEPTKFEQKLSLKNCQAVENGYDLDEFAEQEFPYDFDCPLFETLGITEKSNKSILIGMLQGTLQKGFKKALEILGDKKFSEEDMIKCFNASMDDGWVRADFYIQSLQQTEWEVEIEDHHIGECNGNDNNGCFLDSPGHNCGCYKKEFKLDSEGCLILKRI